MKESALSTSNSLRFMRYGALSLALLGLVGCSDNGMLRNRDFDYLHQDVQQLPPLKVPAGEPTLATTPYHAVPPGPSIYAPVASAQLTPPGYARTYNPKTIPAKAVTSAVAAAPVASSTAVQPMTLTPAAKKQALQQESQALQAQLNELKQEVGVNSTAAGPAAPVSGAAAASAPAKSSSSLSAMAESVTEANRQLEASAVTAPLQQPVHKPMPLVKPQATVESKPMVAPTVAIPEPISPVASSTAIPAAVVPPPVIVQEAPEDSFLGLSAAAQALPATAPVYSAPVSAAEATPDSAALPTSVAAGYLLTLPETAPAPVFVVKSTPAPVVAKPVAEVSPVVPAVKPAVAAQAPAAKAAAVPASVPVAVIKPAAEITAPAPVVKPASMVQAPVAAAPVAVAAKPVAAVTAKAPATTPMPMPVAPVAAPKAVSPVAIPLPSTLTQDAANVGTLKVGGAMLSVWQDLPQALQGSGFTTVSTNLAQGFYFIAPVDQSVRGHTMMLYVASAGYHTTVTVFGVDGRPDGSPEAYQLLQYLQTRLHGH